MKTRVRLKKRQELRILNGHPWIFSNEVEAVEGDPPEPGALVEVRRTDGDYLGTGLYHPHSLIQVRMITGKTESPPDELDEAFFLERFKKSLELRRLVLPQSDAFRLSHSESDDLPGLIVDLYGRTVVIQITSLGMELRKDKITGALCSLLDPDAVVERNDTTLRELEELPQEVRTAFGTAPESIEITENGLRYHVNVLSGQKTGFYLDQRDHRFMIRPYAKGAKVLDLFSNEGGFTLNALAAGAKEVTAVDSSEPALQRLKENLILNGFDAGNVRTIKEDIFSMNASSPPAGAPFDLIVLDPPGMTRSKKRVNEAKRGYVKLNATALQWLKPGGFLATASCSHHIYEDTFLEIIRESSRKAGRRVRIVARGFQPPDHPVLPAMPETRYLKFYILQVF